MKLPWRRHRCPSSAVIEIRVNGKTIVGPVDAEHLGLIARYSGGEPLDLMDGLRGETQRVEMLVTYRP